MSHCDPSIASARGRTVDRWFTQRARVATLAALFVLSGVPHNAWPAVTERFSLSSSGAQGDAHSDRPFVSPGARWVAFESLAGNLLPGDTNGRWDIFVRDRADGTTYRASVSGAGHQADGNSYMASVSADGRLVAFVSYATNLVPDDTNAAADVFVHDMLTGATERVSVSTSGG